MINIVKKRIRFIYKAIKLIFIYQLLNGITLKK